MKTGFRLIGLLLAVTAATAAESRTWTFEKSGKTMEAEVAGFTSGAVALKRPDGKTFLVPTAYLSKSDQAYLAVQRARQWKAVEVVKLYSAESAGIYKKCGVRGAAVSGDIYVERLPAGVEAILDTRNQQATQISNLTAQITGENQTVHDQKAAMPKRVGRNRAHRIAVREERAEVNLENKSIKNAQANLSSLQKSHDDYVQKTKAQTVVKMRNTGIDYKGLRIWECFDPRIPQD
jgi:SLA1 homology domain 1, SHD1